MKGSCRTLVSVLRTALKALLAGDEYSAKLQQLNSGTGRTLVELQGLVHEALLLDFKLLHLSCKLIEIEQGFCRSSRSSGWESPARTLLVRQHVQVLLFRSAGLNTDLLLPFLERCPCTMELVGELPEAQSRHQENLALRRGLLCDAARNWYLLGHTVAAQMLSISQPISPNQTMPTAAVDRCACAPWFPWKTLKAAAAAPSWQCTDTCITGRH